MKYLSIFLLSVLLFTGCKKEQYGNLRQQIRCTSEQQVQKDLSLKGTEELRYTQFGDFITSITPGSCVGEMQVVRYHASESWESGMMTLVMRQPHLGEEVVLADFTNHATLSVIPVLNGTNMLENPDGQGAFYKDTVTFRLLWISMGLRQVIELPTEYTQVELTQFNGFSDYSQKTGNILTTTMLPLNQIVGDLSSFGDAMNFYFGMTDSTYAGYGEILGNSPSHHIRSSNYTEWTMTPPLAGETKTVVSTIGFVNNDLIQVYAGADNVAYTSDDIIVLEPKFWERIYVQVTEN